MRTVQRMTIFLILFVIAFVFLNSYVDDLNIRRAYLNESTDNIIVNDSLIDYDTLTIRQKLAQMIIVRGDKQDLRYTYLNVGGIFLDQQRSEESYRTLIATYKGNSKVDLFVTTDLEGAWTPFKVLPKEHQIFPAFSEIETPEEAYDVGTDKSRLLDGIGFNMNFAPVAEYEDNVYGGRVFKGTKEEIREKLRLYILGLHLKDTYSTCKHYPGRAMHKNLHTMTDTQEITQHDLDLFETCYNASVSAVMVSHQIVTGALDSNGRPASVSPEVIESIDESVLVIVDEVNMLALSSFYTNRVDMYVDLINAGNHMILDFSLNSLELYQLLISLEEAVEEGRISEEQLDITVLEILRKKGYAFL